MAVPAIHTLDTLSSLSYNSTGWSDFKGNFINTILISHSIYICAIQEHMQLENNVHRLQKCFPSYDVFSTPAVKDNSHVNSGRPSGGLAFVYSNNIGKYVQHLSVPNSDRVQGLLLKLPDVSYLYINCYFPVDHRNHDVDILIKTLQDVKYLLDSRDNECNVVMLGDLNADFTRNTPFVTEVKTFLSDYNLETLWSTFNCDFTQCQNKLVNGVNRTYFSTIDHFCVNSDLLLECSDVMPLHLIDNISNHEPIFMKFKCTTPPVKNASGETSAKPQHPLWGRASSDNLECFKYDLGMQLSSVVLPDECLQCNNNKCVDQCHRDQIDLYAYSIMEIISNAVNNNIPLSKVEGDKSNLSAPPVPGWSEFVKPYRDDALFWKGVWLSAGKPMNCELHSLMKRTRNKYHYAIRKVRKQESIIRKNNFHAEILEGNVNNIFEKIKLSRGNGPSAAKTVNGVSGSDNIAGLFHDIYSKIYNTYDDKAEVLDLLDKINDDITESDSIDLDRINSSLMTDVINKLKFGKGDATYNWGSDALKHGVHELAPHFVNLFRAFLVHGHISEFFTFCALVPLVKNAKNSKFTSDNYRLIAISSIMLKILDHIILNLFGINFISPNLQFGFQEHLSTTMCTWTLLETINYYTCRGGSMYVCLLDLTKAFDLVKHNTLFLKLRDKLPPLFLRLIIISYICQSCCIRWDNVESNFFNVSNGVRQGAVASPKYFNVYTDELFSLIKDAGLGCYIDSFYYGVLGYADDFALLSPSRDGLQQMVNICQTYFTSLGIKISVNVNLAKSKTKCLAFNVTSTPKMLSLYNMSLPWVPSHIHLGHFIHTDENTYHDMLLRKNEFISKVHSLRQEVGVQYPNVFMFLVQTYLSSMYGSNLWDMFGFWSNKMYIAWNTCVRSSFHLPLATHRNILYNISEVSHIRTSLIKRFIKFYSALQVCQKSEVRHLFNKQRYDCRSTFGRNCYNISKEYKVLSPSSIDVSNISVAMPMDIPEIESWRLPLISDLLGLREHDDCDIPTDQLLIMLQSVCCN